MQKKVLPIIKLALEEDIGRGDITTKLIIPDRKRIKAVILAKENGVVCGLDVARLVFQAVDKRTRFKFKSSDGKKVKKSQVLARLEGRAASILKAERVALNFLGRLSGIATLTDKFVQKVKPNPVQIMDTRKTTPGLRMLEKYAVRCGGGTNHRMGLWDQVLVKDNHLSSLKLKAIVDKIRKKVRGKKIEIEVKNMRQFKQALAAAPDIIMLDNFTLKNIKKAVKLRNESRKVKLEVSGGVNLSNVRKIAATGVERISVGKLTHSAKALDLALNCE
ncbi:MAG: carboxylating nicotinate-nucleotide diphosphorylase [Omnitrophica bacterium]|nr:carboxylating nicotinate-nucleotide diphosphorylase [Candidatus Omnitrophota bacterium]